MCSRYFVRALRTLVYFILTAFLCATSIGSLIFPDKALETQRLLNNLPNIMELKVAKLGFELGSA